MEKSKNQFNRGGCSSLDQENDNSRNLQCPPQVSVHQFCRRQSFGLTVSMRTIRNSGVSLLNLKDFEKSSILESVNREIDEIRKFERKS